MDKGRDDQNQLQPVEDSWIPKTPFKQVIYTNRQGNQIEQKQVGKSGSRGVASDFPQENRDGILNSSNGNWETALTAKNGISSDSGKPCNEFVNCRTRWNFTSLLALQDQVSSASTSTASYRNGNSLLRSTSQWSDNFGNRSQNYSSSKTTCKMAPVTPDKAAQRLCTNEKAIQEIYESENAMSVVATGGLQTDGELVKDLSFPAGSTEIAEIGDPDKLDETRQQKPRRKKHRPKVITEGKPRPRKPVAPKPEVATETPTGKRKYVRKKPLVKDPTTGKRKYVRKKLLSQVSTPPVEPSIEPTGPQAPELANKSCRRSLTFDIEGQAEDDNVKSIPNANEDSQRQIKDANGGNQSKISTVAIGDGIEVMIETTQAGIGYDLNRSLNQMLQDYISLPEKQPPKAPLPAENHTPKRQRSENCLENPQKEGHQIITRCVQQNTTQTVLQTEIQFPPAYTNAFNWNPGTTLAVEEQANKSKWNLYTSINHPSNCSTDLAGLYYNAIPAYEVQFPGLAKKKRTAKGQSSTSSSTYCMTAAEDIVRPEITGALEGTGHFQYKVLPSASILTQPTISTKKRTRGPTWVRDLASLTKIASGQLCPSYTARQAPMSYTLQQLGELNEPHASLEALAAESCKTLTTKKRTNRRVSLVNSASSSTNDEQSHGKIILYNQNKYSSGLLEVMSQERSSIDAVVERLQHLDINRESNSIAYEDQNELVPYSVRSNQQNALVLYRGHGTVVPFTGTFQPIKKWRPRPKVDLDDETTRVWKLLLGNINSEGIDGTDEEKAKWWKEEREVFSGRANSFIARMHLVQGDRRFSQWKGSVVDSVIGVFLTQNVSDHLSSSAFMSLGARFPLKSPPYGEMANSVIEKPVVYMPDLEDAMKWNEISNQSFCDQSSMTLHNSELEDEREAVYSNESSTGSTGVVSSSSGLETYYESIENRSAKEITKTVDTCYMEETRSANNAALSSQNSAVSSQNSADSPFAQTAEKMELFSKNNSEAEDQIGGSIPTSLNSSNSFVELLIKAGSNKLHEVPINGYGTVLSYQNSRNGCNKTHCVENDLHMPTMDTVDSSLEAFVVQSPSNNCHSHLTYDLKGLDVEHSKMIAEEAGYSDISKNNGRNNTREQRSSTSQSSSQITDENNLNISAQKASNGNGMPSGNVQASKILVIQSQYGTIEGLSIVQQSQTLIENREQQKNPNPTNVPGKMQVIVESSSTVNNQGKISQKTTELDLVEHDFSAVKELNAMNEAKRKAKSRRVGREIREDVDWDALRKEAEANGRKREKTPSTMDSLDWEAVRCADVNEIANTIKERGMNNMLAARIKDFLNRLVRDHGSIDLEWLRDVPPDQAKEYLLSVRGLGLKSVECVRLLTLHHLAFPVDTNVGRIAVRLGWVPLQPLHESLQLHLLELYPVLESIQKYLWPRLCKLDQRTLYELHYQMITFGKVFCTKSKPNCNSCPMRGECRHFASAFASARLALPGPDEKAIVSATENRANDSNPAMMVDQPPKPPLHLTEQSGENLQLTSKIQSEARYGARNCEPIVEEPSSPEPESTQAIENDMEDTFCEDPDEIPTIKLNIEEFTQNLQNYMQTNMELQEADMSKSLVALTAEAASIPMPKLKNVSRLRTEHQVYELPDSHPLLQQLDRREPDDPCSYLLAIWTPGEMPNSIQPPESTCNSQEYGKLCDESTCFSCNSIREANSQIVRGTILIPCRTAMRGSFPLNGTYFQVNEVFADHDSSLNPIDVPRAWIWNLPRRTVYFGTSIPTIFKGLTTEGIQHCFWRGYVCVRGFDQKTRAPRPLMARLHFPASKANRTKGKDSNE